MRYAIRRQGGLYYRRGPVPHWTEQEQEATTFVETAAAEIEAIEAGLAVGEYDLVQVKGGSDGTGNVGVFGRGLAVVVLAILATAAGACSEQGAGLLAPSATVQLTVKVVSYQDQRSPLPGAVVTVCQQQCSEQVTGPSGVVSWQLSAGPVRISASLPYSGDSFTVDSQLGAVDSVATVYLREDL